MANLEIVAYTKYTPTSSVTSRTVTTPAGIQAGDMVHIFLIKTLGSSEATMTGATGYTMAPSVQTSGFTSQYWHKVNASPSDSNVTLTFTTPTGLRLAVFIVVTRGQTATVTPVISATTATLSSSKTLATVTAATRLGYLVFYGFNGDLSTTTDITISPALTEVARVIDTFTGGAVAGAVYIGSTVASGATYGGNVLSQVPATSRNNSAWMIGLELLPDVVVSTVYPSSTVANTGWSPVGAASLHAALADSDDATYAETGDNPNGSTVTLALPALDTGTITVRTRNVATAASPAISRQISLLQGATAIASRTILLTTIITSHSFTLTTEELALVTDRSALRVRITDTAA